MLCIAYHVGRYEPKTGRRIGDDVAVRVAVRRIGVHSSIKTKTHDTGAPQRAEHQLTVTLVLYKHHNLYTAQLAT